jgi:subtilase family serine protease
MNWLSRLVGQGARRTAPRKPSRIRLDVERLEDRCVPADVAHPTFTLAHHGGARPDSGSGSPSGLTPATIRSAYGMNGITFGSLTGDGSNQTIAIVDAYDQPNLASDLAAFDKYYTLSDPPSLTKLNENGGTSLPSKDSVGGWGVETSLDVEWAHVVAPKANIVVFEATSASYADLMAAVNTARNYTGVSVVSMSWGGNETSSIYSQYDSYFTTPSGHQGVTFVASSGDSGAYGTSTSKVVGYPASSPNVLGVGGTTLTTSGGNYSSESGWGNGTSSYTYGGSGGGVSKYAAQPSYQKNVVTQTSTFRAVPDVAFDADPNSGVPVYDTYDDGSSTPWLQVGGTSLAAPMWAGVIAIADEGRGSLGTLDGRTQTLPAIYSLSSSDFHDVTTGNNGYAAGTGYDLVTGRGTPIVNKVAVDLAGGSSSTPTPSIGSLSGSPSTVQTGNAFTLVAANVTETGGTINSVTFYRESNGQSGLQTGSGGDTVLGSGAQAGTSWTINAGTAGLSAGTYTFYAVATDSTGQTSTAASCTVTVTAPATPTIGSFSLSPSSVTIGNSTTLSAGSVTETGGTINSVTFYLESNGSSGLQIGSDTVVGSGKQNGTTWTANFSTANLSPGTYVLYAVATDSLGNTSATSSTTLTVTAQSTTTATTTTLTAGTVTYNRYYTTAYVTLTATVTDASAAVDGGTVSLYYNGSVIATGTVSVVNGVGKVSFNLQMSSSPYYWYYYTLTAQFSGTADENSSSGSVTVAV